MQPFLLGQEEVFLEFLRGLKLLQKCILDLDGIYITWCGKVFPQNVIITIGVYVPNIKQHGLWEELTS